MDVAFLQEQELKEWTDIPLWLNSDEFTYSNQLLRNTGLEPTVFSESVIETIGYFEEIQWPVPAFGISEQRRQELVQLCLKTE